MAFFMAVPVFAIALICSSRLAQPRQRRTAKDGVEHRWLYYIGWMFGHLGFLANATNAYGFLVM